MTQRKCCADDIMGVLLIMVCITILATTIYGILQFTSPETQKSRQCQAIFDTQKSEINEMQQEYYNSSCKKQLN